MSSSAVPFSGGDAAVQHFGLRVSGLPDDAFTVESFRSEGFDLSADYTLQVDVITAITDLQLQELVDSRAMLAMRWEGEARRLHGLVARAERTGSAADGTSFRFTLRSPLHPLALRRGNRVFLGETVASIARQVLEGAGLAPETFRIDVKKEPPAREFVVQYEESDLEFLERQLAFHGLVYAFEQGEEQARLVITDAADRLSERLGTVALDYEVTSGQTRHAATVYEWSPTVNRTVRGVRLNDHNPDDPQRRLMAESGNQSDEYRFGEHYGDRQEGERLARLRYEAHAWQARTVRAKTDCRAVLPGARLELDGHPAPGTEGEWLIIGVAFCGDQKSGLAYGGEGDGPTFEAELTVIPADVPWRAPCPDPRRRVQGVYTARVEGDGGDYAFIDDEGRYRVRLPFDLSDRQDAQASHPVRLAQPYGGAHYGMHFPLHHGTEVLVSFINGDVDRPLILGTVYNPDTPSPVTGTNPSQNILRTWAGNELLMEDRAGEERIELFTPERRNRLALDAKEDGHEVTLESTEGDMAVRAGNSMRVEAGRDHTVEVGGQQQITVQKDQRLITREGDLAYKSGKNLDIKTREAIHLESERGDLSARSGKDFNIRSGQNLSLEVRQRDARVRASKGSLTVQAAKAITFKGQGGDSIKIGQAGSTIEITADGKLAIDATAVEISGGSIAIKGSSVGNND